MKVKDIFTIEIDERQDQMQFDKFTGALLNKYKKVMETNGQSVKEDKVYTPEVSWIAMKGWKEEYKGKDEDWWVSNFFREHSLDNENEFNGEIILNYIKISDETNKYINRAYELLAMTWPEVLTQMKMLITNIYIVEDVSGSNFYSTTAPYWFGGVFIKDNPKWNAVNYLETLLHESGHLSLMMKQAFGRMLNNLEEKAVSPLRKDPRWLNGILHAAFALWRICEGLNRLRKIPRLMSEEELERTLHLLYEYLPKLEEAIIPLQEKGDFTEYGKRFFMQIVDRHLKLKEELSCAL